MRLSFIRICGLYDNFMYPNMLVSGRNNNAKIDFQLIFMYWVCVTRIVVNCECAPLPKFPTEGNASKHTHQLVNGP